MKLDPIVNQSTIQADRFVLRPVRKSDAGLLQMYAGDLRVSRNTQSIPYPMPPGAISAFIARAQSEDRKEDVWVLDGSEKGIGEVMGVISLERMDRDQSEIGYWVAPGLWNSGVASEAVQALLQANPQGCKTMFAVVFQDNPGSARVLTNAGFEYIGDAEGFSIARNARVSTWTYLKKLP